MAKTFNYTHITTVDCFRGSSSTVIPAGTFVELITSRKEEGGEWHCLVNGPYSKESKSYTFAIPFSVMKRLNPTKQNTY